MVLKNFHIYLNLFIKRTMGYFLIKCANSTSNTISNHCIVLDLDETLLHTFDDYNNLNRLGILKDPDFIRLRKRLYIIGVDDAVTKRGEGKHIRMWGLLRPGLKKFLMFCFSYFKIVAIWTAGRKRYAEKIVQELSKDVQEPHIVYCFDHCLDESGTCSTKDLQKIISECPKTMSLKNTFMIDDRMYNFDNNPDNGILIPPYNPLPQKFTLMDDQDPATQDRTLENLKKWFLLPEVKNSEDIRTLDKTNIFSN